MRISIHDHTFNRSIIAEVPAYLADSDHSSDDIATAIMTALGLNVGECEYMIGEFDARIDLDTLNGGKGYGNNVCRLDEYTGNFKEEALEALNESDSRLLRR